MTTTMERCWIRFPLLIAVGLSWQLHACWSWTTSFQASSQPRRARSYNKAVLTLLSATTTTHDDDTTTLVDMGDTGFVLLAGGKGSRMKSSIPKQFLELRGAPILHYSLDLFLERLPAYLQAAGQQGPPYCILVMDPMYQPEYQPIVDRYPGRLFFANPGKERQGSVENGLAKLVQVSKGTCQYVAIHDSARPLVTLEEITQVVADAKSMGTAAVLGVPCKATIKESADGETVLRTIPRSRLFEVHTPQVVQIDLLQRGFAKVAAEQLEVTDDVSIVEAMGEPVRLTRGEYTNLKITTPEDLNVATAILEERNAPLLQLIPSTTTSSSSLPRC